MNDNINKKIIDRALIDQNEKIFKKTKSTSSTTKGFGNKK
jgi:hypothetical protein